MRRLGVAVLGLLLVTACGDQESPPVTAGGDVPITQRAIAAMALQHAPEDTSSREATYTDRRDPAGALGADLRYRAEPESDGDLLRVFVTPGHGPADYCRKYRIERCRSREVDGGTLVVSWALQEPEEDPGYVHVTMQRDDDQVSAAWYGDVIRGDPRRQDLFIPVDTLEAIAQDPRISLTTSRAVVDAGEKLDDWKGGEPDPHAHDRVPSDDRAIVYAYGHATGDYDGHGVISVSPLKEEFGPGAIGGRFARSKGGIDVSATIDVIASPQRPAWLEQDVCDTARFAGHCETSRGSRGQRFLAWVPGPAGSGEIWGIQNRADQVVAIRYTGLEVPDGGKRLHTVADSSALMEAVNSRVVGLTTDQQIVDQAADHAS